MEGIYETNERAIQIFKSRQDIFQNKMIELEKEKLYLVNKFKHYNGIRHRINDASNKSTYTNELRILSKKIQEISRCWIEYFNACMDLQIKWKQLEK